MHIHNVAVISLYGTKRSIEYNRGGVEMWFLVERESERERERVQELDS